MKSFKPNEKIKDNAYVGSVEKYNEIYDYSIKDPEGFWAEQAESCLLYTSPSPRD